MEPLTDKDIKRLKSIYGWAAIGIAVALGIAIGIFITLI